MDLKETIYWGIYGDMFKLFKELMPPQDTKSYWDKVLTRSQSAADKYAQTEGAQFAQEQAMSVVNEIERVAKKERLKHEENRNT